MAESRLRLIRHARAGDSGDWAGDDRLRPLTGPGRRQAAALADRLAAAPIARLMSSPYRRCRQTLSPLGDRLGIPVEEAAELAEGAGARAALKLIGHLAGVESVLCSHGDVIMDVLHHLVDRQLVDSTQLNLEKGSAWVLTLREGQPISARYEPPD